MSVFVFNENVRQQIRNAVDYANDNIYKLDDILDMMNNQMAVPEERSGHLVLVPIGHWICYYLVDHPEHGRCHYFSFKQDASGKLPDKEEMEYALKEFGIENPLFDRHIKNAEMETRIILPINK